MLSKIFVAGLACVAPFAAAYTKPVKGPEGNPIFQPGMNSIVPAGEGFTITWNPTTKGTVTLLLLKGPSTNAVPQYPIAEKMENSGAYVWTPSKDLEPSEGALGYGIQLISDADGQYQYSTQFGISNPDYKKGSSSSSSAPESKTADKPTGHVATSSTKAAPYPTNAPDYTTKVITEFTTYCPESITLVLNNNTYTVHGTTVITDFGSITVTQSHSQPAYVPKPTGYLTSQVNNVTMIAPTGSRPTTLSASRPAGTTNNAPSATYEGPSQQTGAASNVAISVFGLVAAAGAAVLAV